MFGCQAGEGGGRAPGWHAGVVWCAGRTGFVDSLICLSPSWADWQHPRPACVSEDWLFDPECIGRAPGQHAAPPENWLGNPWACRYRSCGLIREGDMGGVEGGTAEGVCCR